MTTGSGFGNRPTRPDSDTRDDTGDDRKRLQWRSLLKVGRQTFHRGTERGERAGKGRTTDRTARRQRNPRKGGTGTSDPRWTQPRTQERSSDVRRPGRGNDPDGVHGSDVVHPSLCLYRQRSVPDSPGDLTSATRPNKVPLRTNGLPKGF